jgi:hypothetical protein
VIVMPAGSCVDPALARGASKLRRRACSRMRAPAFSHRALMTQQAEMGPCAMAIAINQPP